MVNNATDISQIYSDTTDKSAARVVSQKIELIEFPRSTKLKNSRVDLNDSDLQATASKYPERVLSAVTAWLEWSNTISVDRPTRTLIQAITEDWQPDEKVCSAKFELKEHPQPTDEQIMQLRWAKIKGEINDYGVAPFDGGTTMMVDINCDLRSVPWWVYLEVEE